MKKIFYFVLSLIFLINTVSCTGYKPIFGSTEFNIRIVDHAISGDKRLGNSIYANLRNSSQPDSNKNPEIKNIEVFINSSKNKQATAKDTAGKILAYKISLMTTITIKDYITNQVIINKVFSYSSSYKVQDQYSETIKLENRIIDNLVNQTSKDLLIKLSEISI